MTGIAEINSNRAKTAFKGNDVMIFPRHPLGNETIDDVAYQPIPKEQIFGPNADESHKPGGLEHYSGRCIPGDSLVPRRASERLRCGRQHNRDRAEVSPDDQPQKNLHCSTSK